MIAGVVGAGALVLAIALPSFAQDTRRLVHMLHNASDFRARVQAAFGLGNSGDRAVRDDLERALHHDRNPAVRGAAATALGRLGDKRAMRSLRRAKRDKSASVRMQVQSAIRMLRQRSDSPSQPQAGPSRGSPPTVSITPRERRIVWPRIRYVVHLGDMTNGSGFAGDDLASKLEDEVARRLRLMRSVAVFGSDESLDRRAKRQVRRRRLPQLRFEGNVVDVKRQRKRRETAVRCEVSLMLLDEPDRNMRGMLSGAATGSERRKRDRRGQERRLAEQALEGAVRSAMSNAPRALAKAARK